MSYTKQVKAFIRSHKGHTQKALAITLVGIDHMLDHRDWDGLAMLIKNTDGKMGSRIRELIAATVGGVALSADKNHHTGMRFKLGDNFGPTDKLEVLRGLVEEKETIFSDRVRELLGKEKVKPQPKTLEEVRAHIEKYAQKHGFTINDLIAEL